jgi:hypothetical protein
MDMARLAQDTKPSSSRVMLYSAASAAILSSLGNGQKNLEGTAEQAAWS